MILAAKKAPAKKAPAKKQAAAKNKRPTTATAKSKQLSPEMIRQKNQVRSVLLFVIAVFFACLILIEGDNLWRWAHNALLGLFGGWAILGPVLMIYVALVTAMDKPRSSLSLKIWLTVIIIIFFCAAGYIFAGKTPVKELEFFEYIAFLYTNNPGVGGGVIGGLLGGPLIAGMGEVGAKIIIVLLIFASMMILTGTTLIQLFRTIKKPVDVVSDSIQTARQRKEDERLERSQDIDIRLSDELPAHPVHSEVAGLFEKPVDKKEEKKKDNKSLKKLNEVFGIRTEGLAHAETPESQESTVVTGSAVEPAAELSLEPEAATATGPEPSEVLPRALEDMQAAADAKRATNDFLQKRDEQDKNESVGANAAGIYQNAQEMPGTYCFPPVTMLDAGKKANPVTETDELQTNGRVLVETLKSFGVQTKILDICRGPAVTRYELQPAAGVKISKITNLADDLAMNLAATGVRIEAPIPGKAAVGIEVPNKAKTVVRMRELIESNSFIRAKSKLTVALGRDIAGQVTVADLSKMPHMLIAGTTGSGKSVCINSLIISTLYKATPDEVRFLMIDPKVVELGIYNGIPHLLVPVVTDPRKAAGALNWAVTEMLGRYKLFAENNVRDLEGYNSLAHSIGYQDENGQPMLKMPQIVIIIDELSDLMMAAPNEVEDAICRLAQMARAAGMHLVVATQRPSVDVVTGLIKANIPSRIAFAVSSAVDSRTILDGGGAEKLLGQGDMLFSPVGASKPVRIQGCYVSDSEIESIVEFVKKSRAIDYDENVISEIEKNAVTESAKSSDKGGSDELQDPMMEEAIKCVVEAGQASTSLLQRRLRLGYARAGRLVDEMEQMGIVGPHEGSKPRQVLMTYGQWLEKNMQKSDEE